MFVRIELGRWFFSVGNNLTDDTDGEPGEPSTLQYPMQEESPRVGFRMIGDGAEIAEDY